MTDAQLVAIKEQYGIPGELEGCHTGVVGGYVVEGHVPAEVLRRLLRERPAVAGLAVPGMPPGSPGMEGPPPEPYNVVTFTKDGQIDIYERR